MLKPVGTQFLHRAAKFPDEFMRGSFCRAGNFERHAFRSSAFDDRERTAKTQRQALAPVAPPTRPDALSPDILQDYSSITYRGTESLKEGRFETARLKNRRLENRRSLFPLNAVWISIIVFFPRRNHSRHELFCSCTEPAETKTT